MNTRRLLDFLADWLLHRQRLLACFLLAIASIIPIPSALAEDAAAAIPAPKRCGFYLHGCWKYNYPFAVRSWKPADYHNMFLLLKEMGYNTVMLWPVLEAIPMPLSEADRRAVQEFRSIIDDARKCGLETWFTLCVVTSQPEIAAKPWLERSLYAHMKTVRMDDPKESEAYLRHRAALLTILNNADGYVTIDGDPGGYPGAKPADFVKVFLSDRKTIDRVGTHPKTQKVIPWIWAGWGTKGVWVEPIEPFITASLDAIKQQQQVLAPFELLPGRSHVFQGNKRINMDLVQKAGLLDQSTLFFYEAIDFEPSVPSAALQLTDIRDFMKAESALLPKSHGVFGNAETPIMVLPNVYFFSRCAADPKYVDQTDDVVLSDFARFLGGPPELLVPAWSCLQLGLDKLPTNLPAKLREVKLTGAAAAFLPGGASRYMSILASQVDMRIRLLQACRKPAKTQQEAANRIADGTAALVDWWRLHHYVFSGEGTEPFQWNCASQYNVLREWSAKNVTDSKLVADLAVQRLVNRKVLAEPIAKDRIAELLKP
jgi:hypothetical protein